MKSKVVVWGASGHASVVADILRLRDEYDIAGFLDNLHPERRGSTFCGSSILGGMECLDELIQRGVDNIIIAFGKNSARLSAAIIARSKGYRLIRAIHPGSILSPGVIIGAGTTIAAGVVVNPGCHLGENVILNTACSVDHDCVLGDGVHLAPGAILAGHVAVGNMTWIGVGAVVSDHLRIGQSCLIGAGALVLKDIPDNQVAYGSPAKIIRPVGPDEL